MRALLLTDEPMTAAIAPRRIAEAGFAVDVVTDVPTVLNRLEAGGIALCLVDLDLSGGIGPEQAVQILGAAEVAQVPVVAIAAETADLRGWPVAAAKPFTAAQARAWWATGASRLGAAEVTPISLARLAENLGGDVNDALDMLEDYVELALPHHAELRTAIAAEDWAAVGDLAHRVCGALGAIEAREASFTCRQLMNAARAEGPAEARRLAERVVAQLAAVEQALAAHRRGARPSTPPAEQVA